MGPAYLLEGSDASAPRAAAKVFAAALLCREPEPPCLACTTCRRVAAGTHSDVHVQGRDRATVISVEALGLLLERAHASPLEGARQVFVIDPAEAMAPEAVARYLKSLEEPPETTTFVLVSSRPGRLPETVLSRLQRVRFSDPDEMQIRHALEATGVEAARAATCAHWALGSTARARRLALLEADLVVEALAGAAMSRVASAATVAEASLAALRQRALAADEDEESSDDAEREGAPGESLRRALDDVLHAIQVVARDRAAGVEGGPLASLAPETAASVLERTARLSTYVRRNVSPAALLIDAVFAMRRP